MNHAAVLFVVPGDGAGSSMIFVRRQAESLEARGVAVASYYLRSRTSPWEVARSFFEFRRILKRLGPDAVHAHYGTVTALFAALACGRTPLVITYRGSDLNHLPTARGIRAFLGRLMSQAAALKAARIICVSKQLRDALWWRRERVTILASGFDGRVFFPQPRDQARRRLGWAVNQPVVLFNAGRDQANKRLDLARAAARVALETLPDLRLEILDGWTDPGLVPVLMNACDCLLVTSDAEGSPTVVQEALACGLPVVSVEVGDIVERLQGIAPTRIVARDAAALGQALAAIAAAPSRSNGPGLSGELSLGYIAARLCQVYKQVGVRGAGIDSVLEPAGDSWNTSRC